MSVLRIGAEERVRTLRGRDAHGSRKQTHPIGTMASLMTSSPGGGLNSSTTPSSKSGMSYPRCFSAVPSSPSGLGLGAPSTCRRPSRTRRCLSTCARRTPRRGCSRGPRGAEGVVAARLVDVARPRGVPGAALQRGRVGLDAAEVLGADLVALRTAVRRLEVRRAAVHGRTLSADVEPGHPMSFSSGRAFAMSCTPCTPRPCDRPPRTGGCRRPCPRWPWPRSPRPPSLSPAPARRGPCTRRRRTELVHVASAPGTSRVPWGRSSRGGCGRSARTPTTPWCSRASSACGLDAAALTTMFLSSDVVYGVAVESR